jgi:hypothetical protein
MSAILGDTRNQHLYVSRLYKRQERQNVAFEKFQKNLVKEWAQKHYIKLVKYYNRAPSFSMCSPYDFFSDAAISGGRVRCPWNFLFAHAASGPESP